MKTILIAALSYVLMTCPAPAGGVLWQIIEPHGGNYVDMQSTKSGNLIGATSQDSLLFLNPRTGLPVYPTIAATVSSFLFLPGDTSVVAYDFVLSRIVIYDIKRGSETPITPFDSTLRYVLSLTDDGRFVVTFGATKNSRLYKRWDLVSGLLVDSWETTETKSSYNEINTQQSSAPLRFADNMYIGSQDTAYGGDGNWTHVYRGTSHFANGTHARLDTLSNLMLVAISPDGKLACMTKSWENQLLITDLVV